MLRIRKLNNFLIDNKFHKVLDFSKYSKKKICGIAHFKVDLQYCSHAPMFLKIAVPKFIESSRSSTEVLVV